MGDRFYEHQSDTSVCQCGAAIHQGTNSHLCYGCQGMEDTPFSETSLIYEEAIGDRENLVYFLNKSIITYKDKGKKARKKALLSPRKYGKNKGKLSEPV